MYKKDFPRLSAKSFYKLRGIYLKYIHTFSNYIFFYKSYRNIKRRKKNGIVCKQYITKIVNPSAGIGDQLASWITGYYYSEFFNLDYAYSPLYPQKWNYFMGFQEGEVTSRHLLKYEKYHKVWLPYFDEKIQSQLELIREIIDSYKGKKVIFYIEINQVYGEQIGVIKEIHDKFKYASCRKNENLMYDNTTINIAIHVRRGDIVVGQKNNLPILTMRWLEDNYYINVLKHTLNVLNNKKIKIYLFSQGNKEEFWQFLQFKDIEFCLDMSAMNTFLHMVKADILITSKSSFSYKPALLSEGFRICPKEFWHSYPKNEKWIMVDNFGHFSEDAFKVGSEQNIEYFKNKEL